MNGGDNASFCGRFGKYKSKDEERWEDVDTEYTFGWEMADGKWVAIKLQYLSSSMEKRRLFLASLLAEQSDFPFEWNYGWILKRFLEPGWKKEVWNETTMRHDKTYHHHKTLNISVMRVQHGSGSDKHHYLSFSFQYSFWSNGHSENEVSTLFFFLFLFSHLVVLSELSVTVTAYLSLVVKYVSIC